MNPLTSIKQLLAFALGLVITFLLFLFLLPFVLLLVLIIFLSSLVVFLRKRSSLKSHPKPRPKGTIEILPAEKTDIKSTSDIELEIRVEKIQKSGKGTSSEPDKPHNSS